jgi:branched-subunit amino acid ABC-type transport system permease component
VARFKGVFGGDVAVLHSGLSDGERYDAWRALKEGRRHVAIGARSAVFAPVRDLGAIVVDEEHDTSYKQGEAPRYHARDVAIRRAALTGATVVLGSATPSLETWTAAARGAVRLLELPERVEARPLPPVEVVGAAVSLVFLAGFTWFFLKSRVGIAMRAVADSQQVAMAMGINVQRYFGLAWAMAGIVSALGGIVWGAMLGVDNQLAVVGLKVFPVVILGGLDSVIGAVVGGLIVGVVESLAAGYLDPYVGGGTKDFAPYLLMILVLMMRPYGIFGRRLIERV